MEEILHQLVLVGSLSHYLQGFIIYTSQVVQDFFHQQYVTVFFSFLSNGDSLQVKTSLELREKPDQIHDAFQCCLKVIWFLTHPLDSAGLKNE